MEVDGNSYLRLYRHFVTYEQELWKDPLSHLLIVGLSLGFVYKR
jgi:hypothetical protein